MSREAKASWMGALRLRFASRVKIPRPGSSKSRLWLPSPPRLCGAHQVLGKASFFIRMERRMRGRSGCVIATVFASRCALIQLRLECILSSSRANESYHTAENGPLPPHPPLFAGWFAGEGGAWGERATIVRLFSDRSPLRYPCFGNRAGRTHARNQHRDRFEQIIGGAN